MKNIKKFILITFLCLILVYVTNITAIPDKIVLFENEDLNLGEIYGITIKENHDLSIQTSSMNNRIEEKTVTLSLFNIIDIKDIKISVVQNTKIIPLGNVIGLKIYSDGVLVIGMTEIEGEKPYETSDIKEGDLIISVDNVQVTTTQDLIKCVNNSNGNEIEIKYIRDGQEHSTTIEPIKTSNNEYKIGLWVRDGAVGIGTATYYDPSSGKIATLGHGIVDIDTDSLITVESGTITKARISKIKKGEEGAPGEIKGSLIESEVIGNININTKFGIYGNIFSATTLDLSNAEEMEVALIEEIKKGPAKVILALEDGGRKEYDIEIKKIYKNNTEDNKSMLIEITDEELIEKTGGIIQGMSGAPIVQNGKFVGAITHVLVNNPRQGYALFGETMIKQMNGS